MKKVFLAPRWVYLVIAMLMTAESYGGLRQTWLKYKYGEVLEIPLSDLIQTGVIAILFSILAIACWYLWITYYKRNDP